MKQRPIIYYSAEQRSMMWDYYKRGETLHTIAKLFDRHHSAVAGVLARTGGIRPVEPKRNEINLSLEEREEISRGLATNISIRAIAQEHLQPSVEKYPETEGVVNTAPAELMLMHGNGQKDRKTISFC